MFKAEYWMLSTLFACGVIVGLSYLLLSDSNPQSRAASSAGSSETHDDHGSAHESGREIENDTVESHEEANPLATAGTLVEEGDRFLTTENFAAAAKRYVRAQQQTGRITNELSLRIAFCAEFSLQYRAAAEHYNRVIDNRPSEVHRWIASSGLSRCWLERGNRTEALTILCDLFLESLNQQTHIPRPLVAQVNYQLGRALQEVALEKYHYDLSAPNGVAFHPVSPWLEELLLLVDPTNSLIASTLQAERLESLKQSFMPSADQLVSDSAKSTHPQITILERQTDLVELTTIDIQSPMVSIAEMVQQLAASCSLELHVSSAARSLFTAKSKAVNGRNVPVSLILDSLLLPMNVVWFQDEKGLHLYSLMENENLGPRYFPAAMERAYRRFEESFPADYRVAPALLARANLKFIKNDFDQAEVHYQELLQRDLKEETLAKVFFNLGKIEIRLGRNESALNLFNRTVDQTYNRELQSVAYWLVAQVSLELRDVAEAIRAAGRSLALGRVDEQRRRAALTLARAYLISNQPLSANQVLFDNRQVFEGSSLEDSAAVIGSLARFTGMTDKSSLNSEANRLLTVIAMARPEKYQHFLDIYIAARAWQELGFRDKAIEMLMLAADSTSISSWRRQFLFELGIQLVMTNQSEKAISIFEFLIAGEEDEWIEKSIVQLTQLYSQIGSYNEAISTGEKALARNLDENNRQLILQAMGKSFRDLGQHHSAAVCFAGLFPKPSKTDLE